MGKFIQKFVGLNVANAQAVGAHGSTYLSVVNDLGFDEDATLKDWHVMFRIWRAAGTIGRYILAVVPDDMVAAFKAADWGAAATLTKYQQFIWMKHLFFFGNVATYGPVHKDVEFKTSTMRRLKPDYTVVTILYVEDAANINTTYDIAWSSQYKIKSNENT